MKPRIRLKGGIYSCTSKVGDRFRIGLGYSLEEAWKDWQTTPYLCGPMGASVWTGAFV